MLHLNSKAVCRKIASERGWKKELHRNVIIINGEKWSFSVSTFNPECRQVYADTVGFLTLLKNGTLKKYRVKDFNLFSVSRISSSGVRAYNIILKDESKMETI